MRFAVGVVGGANPDDTRSGGLAPESFTADGTGDFACKWISLFRLWIGVLLAANCHFCLDCLKGLRWNNSIMRIGRMVHGQFALVGHSLLCQMIIAISSLKQKISCIGIVTKHLADATGCPCVAAPCGYP